MKTLIYFTFIFSYLTMFGQENNSNNDILAEINTNKGIIVIKLFQNESPKTVENFISLANGTNPKVSERYKNKPFYNGLKFHRVINDFMIQAGDPTGYGNGTPGYVFDDEKNNLKHDSAGIVAMANSGPNTNGSQFYITHKATPWLDGNYTIFGKVVSGQEVVNKIQQNDIINTITIIDKVQQEKNRIAAIEFEKNRIAKIKSATIGDRICFSQSWSYTKSNSGFFGFGSYDSEITFKMMVICYIERKEGSKFQVRVANIDSSDNEKYETPIYKGVKMTEGSIHWINPITDKNWLFCE